MLRLCFWSSVMWLSLQLSFTIPVRLTSSAHNSKPGIFILKNILIMLILTVNLVHRKGLLMSLAEGQVVSCLWWGALPGAEGPGASNWE